MRNAAKGCRGISDAQEYKKKEGKMVERANCLEKSSLDKMMNG